MRREELAHVLRAAARVAGDPDILVIGSQSILGSFWEDDLPEETWMSVEADLAFFDDPGATKADKVDGAIGELSQFHEMYAYYAQGVEVATAVLPDGWRERVVLFDSKTAEPARAFCLDKHDLVVSKLVAYREKDLAFSFALIEAELVELPTLHVRAHMIDDEHGVQRAAAIRWLKSTARKLGRGL